MVRLHGGLAGVKRLEACRCSAGGVASGMRVVRLDTVKTTRVLCHWSIDSSWLEHRINMNQPSENRANFQHNYRMRYLALAAICLLMAAWFGYDGLIGYPSKLPAAMAYDELRELDSAVRAERWKEVAAAQDLSPEVPKKTAPEIRSDIFGQYIWGGLNLLVGLPALILLIRSRGKWVEPTAEGLTSSWGETVRFADVTQLDKTKWARKGIAKARYRSSGGGERVFVFDDFKFEREPMGKMLADLEAALSPEQIIGEKASQEALSSTK
jgi:hypothetical protein